MGLRHCAGAGGGRRALPAATAWLLAILAGGCGTDADFDSAARANTTVAWDDYLRGHPDGPHSREARERLALLLEDREWQRAHATDSVDAYQRYLHGYPQGVHAHDALVAIASLNLAGTPPAEAPASPPPASPPAPGPTAAPSAGPAAPAPPAAARQAPPVAGAAPSGRYRVQLGAFSEGRAAAERAWQTLKARYPELAARTPQIAEAQGAGGRTIVRLQVDGFDRPAAEALCRSLAARHDPCALVAPAKGQPPPR